MTKAETGLPGRPSTTASPSAPGHHRLARAQRDPPEIDRAARRLERGADEVVIADRRAAGGDEDVGLDAARRRRVERVEPVGEDAEIDDRRRAGRRASRRASTPLDSGSARRSAVVPGATSSSPVAAIATRRRRRTGRRAMPAGRGERDARRGQALAGARSACRRSVKSRPARRTLRAGGGGPSPASVRRVAVARRLLPGPARCRRPAGIAAPVKMRDGLARADRAGEGRGRRRFRRSRATGRAGRRSGSHSRPSPTGRRAGCVRRARMSLGGPAAGGLRASGTVSASTRRRQREQARLGFGDGE